MENTQQNKRRKITIIAAVIGIIVAGVSGAYFVPAQSTLTIIPMTPEEEERNEALSIAQRYIVTSPTFAFDGDINTLDTIYSGTTKSIPPQHMFKITFNSAHGGFGNREGQILTQAITPHTMEIIVSEGVVISAVTDGVWDELNNQYVLKAPKAQADATYSFVVFIEALNTQGATVEPVEELEDSSFSVPTQVISVNGEHVQVFEFESEYEAQAASLIVSEDGTEIGTSIIRWISEPHFYTKGKIIVLYVGENQQTQDLLESLLGKQFAGM
ncbi:MAG TPA: hypothetical protein VNL34_02625 [Candidatus Nitrosotenuis sp.]|nr:hypothetical protein [Candidatus Nitrosotenuis sp.]